IHLSRWWNPAVEDQCSDRIYRIGQQKPVYIHYPMAVHPKYGEASFDIRLNELLERKRELSRNLLLPAAITAAEIERLLGDAVGDKT
ncbi:C-terminal helicase domain-containing protein, partial [Vibrio parahaemolyticus]